MQRISSAIRRILHKSALILGLLSLIMSSLFIQQPSLAAPISAEGQKLIQQEQQDKESETANLRQQSYEEQVEAAQNPDQIYEKNLKVYEKDNPGPGLVEKAVEGAEKLVDKVTGKE